MRQSCQNYLLYHASPYVLITDNGREFSSDGWREYLSRHNIRHQYTTAYHPQANGKVERVNRTIKEMLARLSNNNLARWTEVLPEVIKTINITPTRATGFSPFALQTGRDPRLPISTNLAVDEQTYQSDRADFLTRALRDAYHTQQAVREENRRRLNERATAGDIRVGDMVMVWVEVPGTHTTRWDPGFRVVRVRLPTIWVTHSEKGGRRVLHRSKVKVVSPDLAWDKIAPRPTRYQIRCATRGWNVAPAIDELPDEEVLPTAPPPELAPQAPAAVAPAPDAAPDAEMVGPIPRASPARPRRGRRIRARTQATGARDSGPAPLPAAPATSSQFPQLDPIVHRPSNLQPSLIWEAPM